MIKSCSINPDSNFSSQPKPVPQHSEFDDGRTVVQYSIEVSICTVRYPSWMSTENTLTIPFCYYKSHIYTHFLYWNRSPRSPVVVVTQFHSVHPSRRRFDQFASHPFWSCPTHEKHPQLRTHPRSRPYSVHARSAHGSRRASRFTTHTSTIHPLPFHEFFQYLSQTTAEILAPPFEPHTPRESLNRFSDHQVFLQHSHTWHRLFLRLINRPKISPPTPRHLQQSLLCAAA